MKKLIIIIVCLSLLTLTSCSGSMSSRYENAQNLLAQGSYEKAIKAFSELGAYENASKYLMYTKALQMADSGDYATALSSLEALGDFSDAALQYLYYSAGQAEANQDYTYAKATYDSIATFRDAKERGDALWQMLYNQAYELAENGRYDEGISLFSDLGNYQDCSQQITYYTARQAEESEDYEYAKSCYDSLASFRDAKNRSEALWSSLYSKALSLQESGEYDESINLFSILEGYKDSDQQANYCSALQAEMNEDYEWAKEQYDSLAGFRDASERGEALWSRLYDQACLDAEAGNYEECIWLFQILDSYKDSNQQAIYFSGRLAESIKSYREAKSAYISIPGFRDSDERSAKLWQADVDKVYGFYKDLAYFEKDGLIGLANRDRILIPARFEAVDVFRNGFAYVEQGGKRGIIDISGTIRVEPQYSSISDLNFDSYFLLYSEHAGISILDISSNSILNIDAWSAHALNKRFIQVKTGNSNLYGVLDLAGKTILESQFEEIHNAFWRDKNFKNDCNLFSVQKNGKWGVIDEQGTTIVPMNWDSTEGWYHDNDENLFIVNQGGLYGIINSANEIIIDPQYLEISALQDDVSLVKASNGLWGLLDKFGKYIVKPTWQDVNASRVSSEGMVGVQAANGLWGYVDHTGNFIIEPQWSESRQFIEGHALVVTESGWWRLIDQSGQYIIEPEMKNGYYTDYKNLTPVQADNGLWGYANSSGEMVIQPQWYQASFFFDQCAEVGYNADYFSLDITYINSEGEVICPIIDNPLQWNPKGL